MSRKTHLMAFVLFLVTLGLGLFALGCQKERTYTTADASQIEGLVQHPMGRWEAVNVKISGKQIKFTDATTGERLSLNGGWVYNDFTKGSMTDVIRPQ